MGIPLLNLSLGKTPKDLIKNFLKKYYFWISIGVLLMVFIFWKDQKLYSGGVILILISIKQYYVEGLKNKNPGSILIGTLLFFVGLIAILTKPLLKNGPDALVFLVLLVVFGILFTYFTFERHIYKVRWIAIPIIIFVAIYLSTAISPLLNSIKEVGVSNIYFYLDSITFIILINFAYFILIRNLFSLMRIKNKDYLALAISISLFVVLNGYYYLINISKDQVTDFLLIISIGFVTIWGAISSLKALLA